MSGITSPTRKEHSIRVSRSTVQLADHEVEFGFGVAAFRKIGKFSISVFAEHTQLSEQRNYLGLQLVVDAETLPTLQIWRDAEELGYDVYFEQRLDEMTMGLQRLDTKSVVRGRSQISGAVESNMRKMALAHFRQVRDLSAPDVLAPFEVVSRSYATQIDQPLLPAHMDIRAALINDLGIK